MGQHFWNWRTLINLSNKIQILGEFSPMKYFHCRINVSRLWSFILFVDLFVCSGFSSILSIILNSSSGYHDIVPVTSINEFFHSNAWLGAFSAMAGAVGGQIAALLADRYVINILTLYIYIQRVKFNVSMCPTLDKFHGRGYGVWFVSTFTGTVCRHNLPPCRHRVPTWWHNMRAQHEL